MIVKDFDGRIDVSLTESPKSQIFFQSGEFK